MTREQGKAWFLQNILKRNAKHLPQRVVELIAAQEAQSERLIGWVQLCVVAVFVVLYTLTPRPSDAPMTMLLEPVPMALLGYGVFTIARLVIAHKRLVPSWLVVSSILVDTGLLLGLIWVFHSQYGQSAAFSLKVPTFIYFFIFISLRALRFDFRLVLASGFVAAGGWFLLVVAVLKHEKDGIITRNFIDYVNGSRVLIGAEFEKIMTLILVAIVLAIAVKRAREILITAVSEETQGREIRRFLSGGVADAIARSDRTLEAGQAQERLAAILMLDIRGFTSFSKHVSPRDVVQMLTSLHARLIPIIERNGGIVDKFLGDGVMVTFGAVEPSQSAVADAVRTLDEVMCEAEDWRAQLSGIAKRQKLQLNGAVSAGNVVFATLGNADRLEYTVIGEAVNLSAKLEKHNKKLGSQALICTNCYELARRQGYQRADHPAQSREGLACQFEIKHLTNQKVAGVAETMDLLAMRRKSKVFNAT